jgi:hypothetical protein
LGGIWLVAPLVVGMVGAIIFIMGIGHLFGGRPVRGGGHFLAGTPLAVGGFALALLGLNTQTYSRLTHEGPVAEVTVKAVDPAANRYAVTVHRLDGTDRTQTCLLQGDDWMLSGRVQKWKAWANVLGLDATYSLDQISNLYSSAARGNGKPITACDIQGPPPQVNQYMPEGWLGWLQSHAYTVDRRFGDANYMPMADGAVYKVIITQSGFNAEPDNDAARAVNNKAG